jgi:hypothetical protein
VTGDALTTGEWVSWQVQGIIRRWTFLGMVTLVTALVWATRNETALQWWNLVASYVAILIESIVGLAMIGQTRRDALVIREIRALSRQMSQVLAALAQDVERIEDDLQDEIEDVVEEDRRP